jgi:hypothetical protein
VTYTATKITRARYLSVVINSARLTIHTNKFLYLRPFVFRSTRLNIIRIARIAPVFTSNAFSITMSFVIHSFTIIIKNLAMASYTTIVTRLAPTQRIPVVSPYSVSVFITARHPVITITLPGRKSALRTFVLGVSETKASVNIAPIITNLVFIGPSVALTVINTLNRTLLCAIGTRNSMAGPFTRLARVKVTWIINTNTINTFIFTFLPVGLLIGYIQARVPITGTRLPIIGACLGILASRVTKGVTKVAFVLTRIYYFVRVPKSIA